MDSRRVRRLAMAGAAVGWLAIGWAPSDARSQETDERWLAFSGCWQPVGEARDPDAPDALMCFQPAPEGGAGVEMVSVEDGEIVASEVILADGRQRDVEIEGCSGWERADFSARSGRVFVASEYACDGGVVRQATGLLTIVSAEEWIDVRSVRVDDQNMTLVHRYRPARPGVAEDAGVEDFADGRIMALQSARAAGSVRPSVDDVIEASRFVDPAGVSAWLAERDTPLEVDADRLVRLADAGVSEDVIDMVVAVSYPSRFAIDREPEGYGRGYGRGIGDYYGRIGYYDPLYGSLFYSPYGYGYGYGYRYGLGIGFHGPRVVRVDRADSGGRVISGRGYSRGSGAVESRPASSSARATGSSSRGSTGRSTGRTARRRGGGGGGI